MRLQDVQLPEAFEVAEIKAGITLHFVQPNLAGIAKMDLRSWNVFYNWAAIGCAVGTAASLVGIFVTGDRLAKIDEEKQHITEKKLATAESKQGIAEGKLVIAEQKQTLAESKISQLESEAKGRRLSPQQIIDLAHALKLITKPNVPASVMALDGDIEAMDVGDELKVAFNEAGVRVDMVQYTTLIGDTGRGIFVRQMPSQAPLGLKVAAALKSIGLDSKVVEYADLKPGDVQIMVGSRPK
jgi:hypothetical protein